VSAGTLRRGYPAGIRAAAPDWTNAIDTEGRPALVLVEGIYDVEFLCRISTVLHRDDHAIPELRMLEEAGRVIFVPFGGGDPGFWTTRFTPLGLSEIHRHCKLPMPCRRVFCSATNWRKGSPAPEAAMAIPV
jgi:hypothetical protein